MAHRAEARSLNASFPRGEVEYRAIVRTRQLCIEPAQELRVRAHRRNALVLDRGQDCPADQDLATGIAFAFCLTRARDEPALRDAQACEPFVERPGCECGPVRIETSSPPLTAPDCSAGATGARACGSPARWPGAPAGRRPAGRREPAKGALWRFSETPCAFGRQTEAAMDWFEPNPRLAGWRRLAGRRLLPPVVPLRLARGRRVRRRRARLHHPQRRVRRPGARRRGHTSNPTTCRRGPRTTRTSIGTPPISTSGPMAACTSARTLRCRAAWTATTRSPWPTLRRGADRRGAAAVHARRPCRRDADGRSTTRMRT